jgi:hypothetical protein
MSKEVYVKAVRRKEPDLRKLARALIELALADDSDSQRPATPGDDPQEAA